jgi:hypothetical protein
MDMSRGYSGTLADPLFEVRIFAGIVGVLEFNLNQRARA